MPDSKKPRLAVASDEPSEPATEDALSSQTPDPFARRTATGPHGGRYEATDQGIRLVREGIDHWLCNFDAEVVHRRRTRKATEITLRVRLGSLERDLVMDMRRFESLRWVLGDVPGGVVWPGPAVQAHLRAAIPLLSRPDEVHVHDHLGWIRDSSAGWTYLHTGGYVSSERPISPPLISIGEPLDRFTFAGVGVSVPRVVLDLLGLVGDATMVALIAAIVRAVVGDADFAVHISGPTGSRKSSVAAIAQSFWGTKMSMAPGLPCQWRSTSNANEIIAHAAKDCLVVIDDWLPKETPETEVDRLVRAVGNAGGRARMGSPGRAPRAMLVSTGEADPTGASLLARMVVLHVGPTDIDLELLTRLQERAKAGVHVAWLMAFIGWCAPRLDALRDDLARHVSATRHRWSGPEIHARSVDAVAQLHGCTKILLDYLEGTGSVSAPERLIVGRRFNDALDAVAAAQEIVQVAQDPVRLFLATLRRLLVTGVVGIVEGRRGRARSGRTVGWRVGDKVLLDYEAALALVRENLADRGHGLDVSATVLGKALRGAGTIVEVDHRGAAVRYAVRRTCGGRQRSVWVISPSSLRLRGP